MAEPETATPPTGASPAADEAPADSSTALVTTEPAERKKVVKKIVKKKRRPARTQIDASSFTSEPPPQTGTIFNIWYNKWSGGDREDKYLSKTAAKGRCNIARDSGYTRADSEPGSYFCLFFARGICHKGKECEYLHRLPAVTDIYPSNTDCFGRDKFADYRDDMGGVGSFMRQNRTLYVGRIHVTDDIEEVVARHFQEWGQIERTRVLTARGVAFVTYTNEANAQFAREAMAHQSLDNNEILNLRWATVDPNPAAAKREARRIEEQAAEAIRAALPPDFLAEIEGRDPEQKKRRKIEGSFGLQGYDAPDDVWYAREKAVMEAGRAAGELEGEDRMMIEGGEQVGALVASVEGKKEEEPQPSVGFLDAHTLALIESARARGVVFTVGKKEAPKKKTAGPLVAYGSDSDDD